MWRNECQSFGFVSSSRWHSEPGAGSSRFKRCALVHVHVRSRDFSRMCRDSGDGQTIGVTAYPWYNVGLLKSMGFRDISKLAHANVLPSPTSSSNARIESVNPVVATKHFEKLIGRPQENPPQRKWEWCGAGRDRGCQKRQRGMVLVGAKWMGVLQGQAGLGGLGNCSSFFS